jgi:hypothetical protein
MAEQHPSSDENKTLGHSDQGGGQIVGKLWKWEIPIANFIAGYYYTGHCGYDGNYNIFLLVILPAILGKNPTFVYNERRINNFL